MKVYAIKHLPSGEFMPCRMFRTATGGWSHWIPGPAPDGMCGYDGFDKNPRLFFAKRGAQNALSAWLLGVHSRNTGTHWDHDGPDHYDDHVVEVPPVPRVRADMEIIELELIGLGEENP